MTRGIHNWRYIDVVAFLRKRGFTLERSRGSHHYYTRVISNEVYTVTVQFHGSKAIGPRIMNSIIRQSGIPKKEWFK